MYYSAIEWWLQFPVGIAGCWKRWQGLTGCALPRLLDAYDEHQALLKEQETLKRRAENGYGYGLGRAGLGRAGGFFCLSVHMHVFVSFEPTHVRVESLYFSPLKCVLNRAGLP